MRGFRHSLYWYFANVAVVFARERMALGDSAMTSLARPKDKRASTVIARRVFEIGQVSVS